jgi:hypothetical protein
VDSILEHPRGLLGISTGQLLDQRDSWPKMITTAKEFNPRCIELCAATDADLESLLQYTANNWSDLRGFTYLSVHAPFKKLVLNPEQRFELLTQVSDFADTIVFHPGAGDECLELGEIPRSVLENMDSRKTDARLVDEMEPIFENQGPDMGLCLDLAHLTTHYGDPVKMADDFLEVFEGRIRQLHLSSIRNGKHQSLLKEDIELFQPILDKCANIPWILEG